MTFSGWCRLGSIVLLMLCSTASAQDATVGPRAVGIAAYSGGFAVVRDVRTIDLEPGAYTIAVSDIPETVQRDSVAVSAGSAQVLALRFPLQRLDTPALLRRALGGPIKWVSVNPSTGEKTVGDAELLSLSGGITVRMDGLVQTNPPGYPAFETVPRDLSGDAGLDVSLSVPEAGTYDMAVRYITGGMQWRADYDGTLSPDGTRLLLAASAGITNRTGVDYAGATVSLMAGDVNRRSSAKAGVPLQARAMVMEAADAAAPVPEASAVQDYHRYDLPVRADLPSGSERRIPLLTPRAVAVDRVYRLDGDARRVGGRGPGGEERMRPEIVLKFANTAQAGLGTALPAGLVRVYDDGGATPVLLGEDRLPHVAVGGEAELALGRAFDIVALRRQTDFRRTGSRGEFEAEFEVTVRNAKDEGVRVEVVETLFGEWRIQRETQSHRRRDANHAVWDVDVPAGGETVLRFRYEVRP